MRPQSINKVLVAGRSLYHPLKSSPAKKGLSLCESPFRFQLNLIAYFFCLFAKLPPLGAAGLAAAGFGWAFLAANVPGVGSGLAGAATGAGAGAAGAGAATGAG